MSTPDSRLLGVQEVAQYLGVSNAFVYRRAAELGGSKVGSKLRFARGAVDKYVQRQRLDSGMRVRAPK